MVAHRIQYFMDREVSYIRDAHEALRADKPDHVGISLRKALEAVFKDILVENGFPENKVDSQKLDYLMGKAGDFFPDETLFPLYKYAKDMANLTCHDQRRQTNIPRADHLFSVFLCCYIHLKGRVMGRREAEIRELIAKTCETNPGTVTKTERPSPEPGKVFPDESITGAAAELFHHTPVAVHQQAIQQSGKLEEWKQLLVRVAFLCVRLKPAVDFVRKTSQVRDGVRLMEINILDTISLLVAGAAGVECILYIGSRLDLEKWRASVTIFTDNKEFLDFLARSGEVRSRAADPLDIVADGLARHKYIERLRALFPETTDLRGTSGPGSAEKYFAPSRKKGRSLAAHTNISLLRDDHELALALKYPMQNWRLFLHPSQEQIIQHPARFLFVEGGPGTGKTVVLIHRVRRAIEKNRELEKKKLGRSQLLKVLVFTFSPHLAKNITAMLRQLDNTINDNVVDIFDFETIYRLLQSGEITIAADDSKVFLKVRRRLDNRTYYYTDVLVDEFQDFPLSEHGGLRKFLYRFSQTAHTKLFFSFDSNQMIYHIDSDIPAFMGTFENYAHEKLRYCYRLSKEVFDSSLDYRRRATDLLRNAIDEEESQQAVPALAMETTPEFALRGQKLNLISVPFHDIQDQAECLIKKLLKTYDRTEIALISFHTDQHEQSSLRLKDIRTSLRNLRERFGIPIHTHMTVKGLEFKAGIILYGHLPFMPLQKEITNGHRIRHLIALLEHLSGYASRLFNGLNANLNNRLDPNAGPLSPELFDSYARLMFYLSIGHPGAEDYDSLVAQAVDSGKHSAREKIAALHTILNKTKRSDFNHQIQAFSNFNQERFTGMSYREKKSLRNAIRALKNILDKELPRARIAREELRTDVDRERSFMDMNRFYVATTRFRDSGYIIYDKNFPLENFLAG